MLDFSPLTNALSNPVDALMNGNMGTTAFLTIALLVVAGFIFAVFGARIFRFLLTAGSFGGGVAIGYLLLSGMAEGITGIAIGVGVGIVIGIILLRLINWLYNRFLFIVFTPLFIVLTSVVGGFLIAFAVGGFLPIPFGNLIITGVIALITMVVQAKAALKSKKNRIMNRFGDFMSKFGYSAGMVSDDFVGGFMKGYGK